MPICGIICAIKLGNIRFLKDSNISSIFKGSMAVSIDELEKAVNALESVLKLEKNDVTRDATIQRFEFCIELSWKVSRKVMGSSTTAPKEVIREMAQNNLINDVTIWLQAIDERNISSHTYNEDLANKVYAFSKVFLPLAQDLVGKLRPRS